VPAYNNVIANDINDLLAAMLPALQIPMAPAQNFMEPVIVRPSAAQVEAGTSIEIVDAEEDVCAVCQDRLLVGSQARSINACDHRFHTGCIDTWFQQNVHCPVCRHDIRDPSSP
jgi:Ring finger domain